MTNRRQFLRPIDKSASSKLEFLRCAAGIKYYGGPKTSTWPYNGVAKPFNLDINTRNKAASTFNQISSWNRQMFGWRGPDRIYFIQDDIAYKIGEFYSQVQLTISNFKFKESNTSILAQKIEEIRSIHKVIGYKKIQGIDDKKMFKVQTAFADVAWVKKQIAKRKELMKLLNTTYKEVYETWVASLQDSQQNNVAQVAAKYNIPENEIKNIVSMLGK